MPYKKGSDVISEAVRGNFLPTQARMTADKKDLYFSGHNNILTEKVDLFIQNKVRKGFNNTHRFSHQVNAKAAGYPDFGPQLVPHNVPAQPKLYLYKR